MGQEYFTFITLISEQNLNNQTNEYEEIIDDYFYLIGFCKY